MLRYEEGIAAGEEPGIIIRQAKIYDVAPALVAKVILEETIEKKNKNGKLSYKLTVMSKGSFLLYPRTS